MLWLKRGVILSNLKENKMGTMPVAKLLITMTLPMMASMLVQALYNIVDSMFVSWISEEALTALSLAFPVQNFMIGVATGTGVGMNSMLSKSLGEKDDKNVQRAANNGVFLMLVSSIVFILFGLFGTRLYFELLTDNQTIITFGAQYLSICSIGSIFIFMQIIFERLMQATGKTIYTMFTQGAGAIINIALDPVFIFVFKMDVVGAALATVIGQAVACFTGIILNQKFNPEVRLNFRNFKPHKATILRIYSVGIPSIIMMAIGSIMNFSLSKMLLHFFSETCAAIFGVYFKIQSFAFMPLFGLNNGVIPIVAYNYGAGKRSRVIKCIKLAVLFAVLIMLLAFTVFQIFPSQLLSMFAPSEDMLKWGIPAFRTISTSYIFAGFCIALGTVFQAFGKGLLSMIVSIARQLLALVPAAFLLAYYTRNVNLFWLCFPIAEVISLIVSVIFFIWIYKTLIKKIPDNK